MRAILIDDEKLSLDTLEYDIREHCPQLTIVDTFTNPFNAIEGINIQKPDIVISDIEMPGLNVFGMINKLEWNQFALVLVTAYNQYAVKAFEFSAVDYIVKPVDPVKLIGAVQRAEKTVRSQSIEERLSMVLHNLDFLNNQNLSIAIPSIDGAEIVQVSEIIRIEASANYCQLQLLNNTKMMVSKPLKHFADILPESSFIRIHQSHLVNKRYIKSYRKGKNGSLILKNGDRLPISRPHMSKILDSIITTRLDS